jgi:hypothetical protein
MTARLHPDSAGRPDSRDVMAGVDLRPVAIDGFTVAARLFFAVRDHRWRTPPLVIARSNETQYEDGASVEIFGRTEGAPVDVQLLYSLRGGVVRVEATATLTGAMRFNRIGFCLLLDEADVRGSEAESSLGDAVTAFRFPEQIVTRNQVDEPTAAFHAPFRRLRWTIAGRPVEAEFAGSDFEFEDQRNWTDPSYKAYSVAPASGIPVDGRRGIRVHQTVVIRPTAVVGGGPEPDPIRQVVIGPQVGEVPVIREYRRGSADDAVRPAGGFQEFNARRPAVPPGGIVRLAVNGAVHADDERSVFETTRMHGRIVEEARRLAPDSRVRLGPVGFLDASGDWRDALGRYVAEPVMRAEPDSRSGGEFGAGWIIASAVAAVPAGPESIEYLLPPGDGAAREVVRRLSELAGRPVLRAALEPADPRVMVLAVDSGDTVELMLANTGADAAVAALADGEVIAVPPASSLWRRVHGGAA